jgi:uncharacterized protein (TIGR02596 family)
MRPALHSHRRSRHGFSLIEILCVLVIISLLTVLGVSSIQPIMLSANLTSSATLVVDSLNLARQRAVSNNCPVEVRIYQVPATAGSSTLIYRALGIYQINTDGPQLIHMIIYLTGNVEFSNSQAFGTLLYYTTSSSGPLIPGSSGPSYTYQYFQYRADGSTNLNTQPVAGDTWHMMLYNSNRPPVGATPPANYISIQLDPISGRTETFQPGM